MKNERIKARRKELKLTQAEISNSVGVSKVTVSQWESGDYFPRGENLYSLCRVLKCTPDWLLYGKERVPEENSEWIGAVETWDDNSPLGEREVEIPFFTEVALSEGYGADDVRKYNGSKLRISKSTLTKANVKIENSISIVVTGSSMEPALFDGTIIGVDIASNIVKDGEIYAINHDGLVRIKLIYRLPGHGLRLKSYNSAEYPEEVYDADSAKKIKVIGRVFWISSVRP